MRSSRKKTRHYLAMWDMYGLECVYDLTQHNENYTAWEKQKMWSNLKGEDHPPAPLGPPLPMMVLRAKVNGQRRYEIYEFMSEFKLEKIKELFKSDPNFMATFIRENGVKIYSDYEFKNKQVVF